MWKLVLLVSSVAGARIPPLAPANADLRCDAIADHMLVVSPPDPRDHRPFAQYTSLHQNLVDACRSETWSVLRRRCLLVAPNGRAMVPCLAF
jgi:hypothetical protein